MTYAKYKPAPISMGKLHYFSYIVYFLLLQMESSFRHKDKAFKNVFKGTVLVNALMVRNYEMSLQTSAIGTLARYSSNLEVKLSCDSCIETKFTSRLLSSCGHVSYFHPRFLGRRNCRHCSLHNLVIIQTLSFGVLLFQHNLCATFPH